MTSLGDDGEADRLGGGFRTQPARRAAVCSEIRRVDVFHRENDVARSEARQSAVRFDGLHDHAGKNITIVGRLEAFPSIFAQETEAPFLFSREQRRRCRRSVGM